LRASWALAVGVLGVVCCASGVHAQNVNWPSERPPRPLAPRSVKFPPYEIKTLANGMQVIAVLHHEQPLISMRLLVRAGSLHDAPDKVGVANLTSSLLDQGTATKSAQQIADEIDFIGGALGAGSGPDLTFVNVVVMKDSFAFGMDMLADVTRNPAFADQEIERQKEQILSSLQVNRGDPDYVARVVFDRLVYGFHPYGLPDSGTAETLARITRADLQTYHRRYFVPNNMILAIVGDVTGAEAFAAAERVFGGWARGDIPPANAVDPPQPTRRVVVIDKPDAVQTEIRAGQLAIPRKHQDYLAWDLAVKILGGEGANRLHRVLRSERGLTYAAAAESRASKYAGDYVAETDTRTETTGEALRLMIDEFAKLPRDRVFEGELANAQAYLAGSFPLTIETPNDIATQVLNVLFYELPIQEIETFRERLLRVTPDDIQRVARQYIRPDRLSIVLVGNAAAFVPQLKAVGFTDFEVIPIEQLDLTSATLRAERRAAGHEGPPRILAGAARTRAARETAYTAQATQAARTEASAAALLKRVIEAKGGHDQLRKVRTVVAEAETTFRMEQGVLASATKTYVAYPAKFRVDATIQGADVVQVYNGGTAWVRDPGGVHDAPAPMRDEFAAAVRRDIIPLLIGASEGKLAIRTLPEEGQDGRVLRVLEMTGEGLASPVRLYIDMQDLIARQAFTITAPGGQKMEAVEIYSDYRRVDGLQVPFKAELLHNGRPILARSLSTVTINTPLDDTLFTRPQ
jgi:zinc protease